MASDTRADARANPTRPTTDYASMYSIALSASLHALAFDGGPVHPPSWAAVSPPAPVATTTNEVPTDAPPRPRSKPAGRGLAIATGAVGAAAIGMGIGRALMVKGCLDDLADGAVGRCRRGGAYTGLRAGQAIGNLTAFGLVIGTGIVAGLYDGAAGVRGERPRRNAPAFIGGGAATMVAGVAVQLGGFIAGIRAFTKPECLSLEDSSALGHCVAKGATIAMITNQLGTSVSQVGVGLLTYGIAHRRGAERERRVQQVRFAPSTSLARGGNATIGLTVSGRF